VIIYGLIQSSLTPGDLSVLAPPGIVQHGTAGLKARVDVSQLKLASMFLVICYGLNVCVSPKCVCWNPNPPPIVTILGWGPWEVIRSCGWEDCCLPTGTQALTRHRAPQQLDLGLPASRTMRNKCLLFKITQSMAFCFALQVDYTVLFYHFGKV